MSRYPVPPNVDRDIRENIRKFGLLRLKRQADRLVLASDETELLNDLWVNSILKKFLEDRDEDGSLVVKEKMRGEIKQALIKIGYPVEDLAGYVTGAPYEVKVREETAGGEPFGVRRYQREAADVFHAGGTTRGGSGVIVLPCGAGKTIVGIEVMNKLQTQTLVLTTNTIAVRQWQRELKDKTHIPEEDLGEYTGEVKNIRPITVTTYQILTYRKRKTDPFIHFDLFSANNWGLVIYDEVHLLPAPVFRVTAEIQARRRLGLTATLVREDHKEDEVFSLIGPKKYDVPWKVLEKQGWIAQAHCIEVRVPLEDALKYGYLSAGAREKFRIASENPAKTRVVEALIEKHEGDQILIIGQYLDQLRLLARHLDVPLITGKMPTKDRALYYGQFRTGEIKILMVSKVGELRHRSARRQRGDPDFRHLRVPPGRGPAPGPDPEAQVERADGLLLLPGDPGFPGGGLRQQPPALPDGAGVFLRDQGRDADQGHAVGAGRRGGRLLIPCYERRGEAADRHMITEKALRERPPDELKEIFSFWDGESVPPERIDKLVPLLVERMTDDERVRKRLGLLSKKLLDVLKFFLRSDSYSSNIQHILNSKAFSYMSQYEMEAALNALQKRGFLYRTSPTPRKAGAARSSDDRKLLLVPEELGDILQSLLWDEETDIFDTFSLHGFLSKFSPNQMKRRFKDVLDPDRGDLMEPEKLVRDLARPEEIRKRVDGIEDEGFRRVIERAICEFGGVLPASFYDRVKGKLPAWNYRKWKDCLERNLLGTVRHLSLGEYGINHFDDTLVVFHEVVSAYMTHINRVETGRFTDVKSLGVDLISDISSFLSFVNHNKIRLTLNGTIYKTAIKKVMDTFILAKKEEFDEDDIFQCIYSFCLSNRMIQRKGDRNLTLTVKGKVWDHQPLERKLFSLISFAFEEWEPGEDQFHVPHLKKMFVEALKGLRINRWYDVMHLPFQCRNRYLANLDNNSIRDAFQNRYQYTQSTNMRDTVQLAHSLFQWLKNRFFLLGLLDLAHTEGKVTAMRLNPLGAKGLGISMEDDEDLKQNPLIVNPDFEVILFQDGDSYDLIMLLDKFARRLKSDNTYHFKITATSVEKAVAGGMTSSEIITILSENSRVGIPQNVIYSIKEWGEKVKFVQVRKVTLLRGRSKEVIDRIMQAGPMKSLVIERIAPTAVVINDRFEPEKLATKLEKLGIFLEGLEAMIRDGVGDAPVEAAED